MSRRAENKKPLRCTGTGPPSLQDVKIYFSQKGMPECEAVNFFRFYEKKKWKNKNGPILTCWKNIAYRWIGAVIQGQPLLFDRRIH